MTQSPASTPVFPGQPKIRLGVWGLGRGLHLGHVFETLNYELVAGCDFNPHFQEIFRQRYPAGRCTADAAEFLSWDFDAVLLATFCPDHAAHAIAALRADKHVLSEVTAFHTPAEGVALVEAVERTGKIYQLAENYPYTPANRYLARLWRQGLFGDFMYAEYSYVHDCLNLAYTYIDGTPVEPGWTVHNWRSWLPWHYYNTHSLGPVMVITGRRPVKVAALPGTVQLPGHLLQPPEGLGGVAPSLLTFDNGGLMRNLMGGTSNDQDFKTLYGTRGASELVHGKLLLRLGGRGESPRQEVRPEEDDLGRLAARTGHGGGDFWTLYHFANQILHGVQPPFDVYAAADVTLPGIQAYRSARAGGEPQEIPDFRDRTVRRRYRDDHFAAPRLDPENGIFPKRADRRLVGQYTRTMRALLGLVELAQSWRSWSEVFAQAARPENILALGHRLAEALPEGRKTLRTARAIAEAYPRSTGARPLRELLAIADELGLAQPACLRRLRATQARLRASLLPADPAAIGENHSPQLLMRRVGFADLPPLELPAGYTLRAYQEGDSVHWRTIIGESFGGEKSEEDFQQSMVRREGYAPERILFIVAPDGTPCATASAYGDARRGYVHYVGTRPSHAGHKLGYWVSLAVLHAFRERGCADAILDTDDFRRPALKIYLRLGFHPLLRHDNQPARWRAIAARLGQPEILDALEYP